MVDCSPETQITRAMARSALDRPAVEAIIAAQASREQRRMAADLVILNVHISLAELAQQVHALATGFGLSWRHIQPQTH